MAAVELYKLQGTETALTFEAAVLCWTLRHSCMQTTKFRHQIGAAVHSLICSFEPLLQLLRWRWQRVTDVPGGT
jgi:hypothetical protein